MSALDEDLVDRMGGKRSEVQLVTKTLDTLLQEHGVEKIDFVSLDIEGAELAALRGFDLERYRPELLCIEGAHRDELSEHLSSRGYERIEKYRKVDKINAYFRPAPPGDENDTPRGRRNAHQPTTARYPTSETHDAQAPAR